MQITPLDREHRGQVNSYVREEWGGPAIVSRGNLYDSSRLPGFVAVESGILRGGVLYRMDGGDCEIAVLFSLAEGKGVGSALIAAVLDAAGAAGCRRVWLITTNDNTHAIRFYQRRGFDLTAVHFGAMDKARRLKPGIPERGIDDIPLLHEFEFEICL